MQVRVSINKCLRHTITVGIFQHKSCKSEKCQASAYVVEIEMFMYNASTYCMYVCTGTFSKISFHFLFVDLMYIKKFVTRGEFPRINSLRSTYGIQVPHDEDGDGDDADDDVDSVGDPLQTDVIEN